MSFFGALSKDVKQVLAVVETGGVEQVSMVTVISDGFALVEKLFSEGKTLAPEVKVQLTAVVQKGEAVAAAITAVTASRGGSWTADTAAVTAVEEFVPAMIAALKVLRADAAPFLPGTGTPA